MYNMFIIKMKSKESGVGPILLLNFFSLASFSFFTFCMVFGGLFGMVWLGFVA